MATATGEHVPQLIDLAQRLRQIRNIRQQFLVMWRLEQFQQMSERHQSSSVNEKVRNLRR
ncbi:MAG TPA: hypothetical protein VGB55_13440 [Tepidisphaeraceae bacterium]|jgi:thymidylate synthase